MVRFVIIVIIIIIVLIIIVTNSHHYQYSHYYNDFYDCQSFYYYSSQDRDHYCYHGLYFLVIFFFTIHMNSSVIIFNTIVTIIDFDITVTMVNLVLYLIIYSLSVFCLLSFFHHSPSPPFSLYYNDFLSLSFILDTHHQYDSGHFELQYISYYWSENN